MKPETEIPQHGSFLDPAAWISQHPRATVWICALCLWISVVLILRVWLVHRRTQLGKKVIWSLILLVPLFGWIAYAGFFSMPDTTNTPELTVHSD